MTLRVLIADDEPLAREALHDALSSLDDVAIVATCADGASAAAGIRSLAPDVAFLDIAMPGLSGIDVARALDASSAPLLIFVTAFDSFAVEAFELAAADYILKPFAPSRIAAAVDRARSRLAAHEPGIDARLTDALDALHALRTRGSARLLGTFGNRIVVLELDGIEHLEAEGNYVRAHAVGRNALVRGTLAAVEARFPTQSMLRVHRSHSVSVAAIRELHPLPSGDYEILLASGALVPMSRTHRDAVLRTLRERS